MADTKPPIVRFPAVKSWAGSRAPEIPADGEQVIRQARLRAFGMEAHCVSVARFAAFVSETGYQTDAERLGWSYVFRGLLSDPDATDVLGGYEKAGWWWAIKGADWRFPAGSAAPEAVADHPATQISWNDARAFATWAGGRLPTEVEWEHAARGGIEERRYPWGEDEPDDHKIHCNIWQGRFPDQNTCADGYYGTAPVDAATSSQRSESLKPRFFRSLSTARHRQAHRPFTVTQFSSMRHDLPTSASAPRPR